MIHVNSHHSACETFCGARWECGGVDPQQWIAEPEAIQRATCPQCLLRVFMFGDSASIALKRMGMKVDVHDVDPELQAEN